MMDGMTNIKRIRDIRGEFSQKGKKKKLVYMKNIEICIDPKYVMYNNDEEYKGKFGYL